MIRRKKSVQLRTDGTPFTRASVSALWGPKALDQLVDLDLHFSVEVERAVLRRQGILDQDGFVVPWSILCHIDQSTIGMTNKYGCAA